MLSALREPIAPPAIPSTTRPHRVPDLMPVLVSLFKGLTIMLIACLTNCNVCVDSVTCNQCISGKYVLQGSPDSCVSPCPTRFYPAGTGFCTSKFDNDFVLGCRADCAVCTTGTDCTTCDIKHFKNPVSAGVDSCPRMLSISVVRSISLFGRL